MYKEEFMVLARKTAERSPCLRRKVGCALLLRSGAIITNSNSPPEGFMPCDICPRMEYKSGEALHLCHAVHAEAACVASAALLGLKMGGSVLYTSDVIPCKSCIGILINAGVHRIYVDKKGSYDKLSIRLSDGYIRERKEEEDG